MEIYMLVKNIRQKFTIQFKYTTIFTKDVFSLKNNTLYLLLKKNKTQPVKVIFIIDDNVVKKTKNIVNTIILYCNKHKETIRLQKDPIVLMAGESIKNSKTSIPDIYRHINVNEICRQSYVIAIGGGSLLDAVGFAAATAHRGVRLIRIPTTTLSQNDSGVGVKNGVNYYNKKNFIGSFYPPIAVINDYSFLKTLQIKDWLSGLPEALKVSLIKTKRFFFYISKKTQDILNRKISATNEIDYLCAKLHIEHIGLYGDPFEMHSSRPLDFGHWSAHKLETATKNKITHGHAVAIGIAIDCTYSFITNLLTEKEWKEILFVLLNLNFNIYNKKLTTKKGYMLTQGLTEFKEHLGGILTITLLRTIGKGISVNKMDTTTIKKTILLLKKIQKTYDI